MAHGAHPVSKSAAQTLAARVAKDTGTSPLDCYQCGRCSASCPQNVPGEMDISPTRMMHLLQLEAAFAEEPERAGAYARQALGADTSWLCLGCNACTARCPQSIDIAATMDVLRQEGLRRGLTSQSRRVKNIQTLHQTFLAKATHQGRIHELALVGEYKVRSLNLFSDALLGVKMFLKGRLNIMPPPPVDTERVRAAAQALRDQESAKPKAPRPSGEAHSPAACPADGCECPGGPQSDEH